MAVAQELTPTRPPGSGVRVGVWVGHMALPLLALWLLLAQPDLDVTWQHRPSHFWLVMVVAAVNVGLSLQVLRAARSRGDARLLLAGYAFMVAAGFLLLHALATPGVIVSSPNSGFEIATPVGLAAASVFFLLASVDYSTSVSQRLVSRDTAIRWVLVGAMVVWGVLSVAELPPLAEPIGEQAVGPLRWMAIVAIALYSLAAVRFFVSHRRKPSVMLVALITGAVLLAEAMATIIWARSWQLSWWLWHLLMAAGFGFVAYSAYTQYQKEGAASGIFDGIVTRETGQAIRQEYGSALETLTDTLQRAVQVEMTDGDIDLIITGLRARFDLTEGQTEVLARAARSLATERDQTRRLGALAEIATGTWVERTEDELLEDVVAITGERFSPDLVRVGLAGPDGVAFPDRLASELPWPDQADRYSRDLVVAGETSGVVEFARPNGTFRPRDFSIMDTLAAEVGIAVENVRLYRQLDTLFKSYLSPDVVDSLKADPSRADLGGSMVEVTALFADLRGFTGFSESTDPVEVMELLNRYFGVAVPVVLRNGGTVVQFVGDAMLAVFDAPRPRPDHEYRAVRSALEMQDAIASVAGDEPGAPRFRIGVNTGLALIGNIGSTELRSFNVVGDAINVASRLETSAEPGSVVIGEATARAIEGRARVVSLGSLELKGRDGPVNAYRLDGLSDHDRP